MIQKSNYVWLNEFNQANIWEILNSDGDRLYCRLPTLARERWFTVRDTFGFWVWWNGQRRYIYERKGSRLLIEIEISGIGENLWVNASEVKPLTFEENQAFAAEVVQRYQKKLGRIAA